MAVPPHRVPALVHFTAALGWLAVSHPLFPAEAAPTPPARPVAEVVALPKMPSPPYLSPQESAQLVQLPPGYRLELVLS